MSKKVSNSAERMEIEKEFGVSFVYPNLYRPSIVIDGTKESTLSVIIAEKPNVISYAIWGMLPEHYEEQWQDFQNAMDTLSVPEEKLLENNIFKKAYEHNRCLIIVTGFFVYHLYNGILFPYYVYQDNKKPFALAGIYTILEDGFITCSLLKSKVSGLLLEIQNIDIEAPNVISKSNYSKWLDMDADMEDIQHILTTQHTVSLKAHPINREFFKNDISYESMLKPVNYDGIPSPE